MIVNTVTKFVLAKCPCCFNFLARTGTSPEQFLFIEDFVEDSEGTEFLNILYWCKERRNTIDNGEQDWIFYIAQVVEQKIGLCTESPSPLHMERRMRGEVILLSITTPNFLNILNRSEQRRNTTNNEADPTQTISYYYRLFARPRSD